MVVRRDYAAPHPEVLDAFLQAQLDATNFLNETPLDAARIVADGSGLPQEVVYLYNGPGGTSFDTTLKPSLVDALKGDVPYLKSIGDFADLDVVGFVQDGPLRNAFAARGRNYDTEVARTGNPSPSTARSGVQLPVDNPALASELWLDGADTTQPAANPTCLLKAIRDGDRQGRHGARRLCPRRRAGHPVVRRQIRVGAATGTELLPFDTTRVLAATCRAPRQQSRSDYQQALAGAV